MKFVGLPAGSTSEFNCPDRASALFRYLWNSLLISMNSYEWIDPSLEYSSKPQVRPAKPDVIVRFWPVEDGAPDQPLGYAIDGEVVANPATVVKYRAGSAQP